jgi:hypothetical protein
MLQCFAVDLLASMHIPCDRTDYEGPLEAVVQQRTDLLCAVHSKGGPALLSRLAKGWVVAGVALLAERAVGIGSVGLRTVEALVGAQFSHDCSDERGDDGDGEEVHGVVVLDEVG